MTVFISYRHSDRTTAFQVNAELQQAGIKTYMDVFDAESQSTENITAVITKNVAECTHLIAVISGQTALSWWVPFEIGEATISATRIASYRVGYTHLPEYLEMWPQMTNSSHLALFISEYKKEQSTALNNKRMFESAGSVGTYSADTFHKTLKNRISRGY
ncbi:toll/interleukin-1 receptor domain-containing protein [Vibrio parahaemolyticus]|uniref:toll/interleukin-1 receptor domain-containing protein n=1 Tax=Vibrio TaxID=662 RepID=UPI00177E69E3|nr:toll/interleukin-1 receptor domain-containing protein [Vibrio parahaemolyticus]EJE4199512.1 toll/interleukin-1 receptor domain-containing protein [Vibrio cholerae]EGU0149837.1 toll/interleukin-1 receptor domain-containing protein [Vibrio parahaemolyticus]MBD6969666.1 toll/interleukin-1 receptor domain-containing protein [Vibrio parahaemolyticus]MBD6974356.1 toll/interleukin-1 receptor domain-containing protein [Vibrio parahaemolyticus]MCR9712614.1 toll/interleukin-1 receptor domain-containi